MFVCGRKYLATEVLKKIRSIFETKKIFKSSHEIENYIRKLKNTNRYHEDLFNS